MISEVGPRFRYHFGRRGEEIFLNPRFDGTAIFLTVRAT